MEENNKEYQLTDKGRDMIKRYLKELEPTKCSPGFMDKLNERIKQIDKGE